MARDRWAKTIIASLERELGLNYEFRKNGHLIFNCELNGHRFRWTLSSTPSDGNTDRIELGNLRRELRKCGVAEPPQFNIRGLTGHTMSESAWGALRNWEDSLSVSDSDP
jgi:hypothetical protein